MTTFQVVIYIKDLPIVMGSADLLEKYVDAQRKQGKDWALYEHYPLLKVVDIKTGESYEFPKAKDLPKRTIKTKKGEPLIIIKDGKKEGSGK